MGLKSLLGRIFRTAPAPVQKVTDGERHLAAAHVVVQQQKEDADEHEQEQRVMAAADTMTDPGDHDPGGDHGF